MKDCRFRDEVGCSRALCGYPSGIILCGEPMPASQPTSMYNGRHCPNPSCRTHVFVKGDANECPTCYAQGVVVAQFVMTLEEKLTFEKFKCRKTVCPVGEYEDFDKTGNCPCCGTLGVKADG